MLFFKNKKQEHSLHLPSFGQWTQFFKILSVKEKVFFLFLVLIFSSSLIYSVGNFYYSNTRLVPSSYGTLREGMVGQPQFINPLYAQNSEIDKSLLELVFSGLVKYDADGKIIPDLIKDYRFTDDGRTFEFSIKDNVKWHDDQPLTIDDVIFTINLIQDPSYLSFLHGYWTSTEIVKTADNKAIIKLKQPFSGFLDNLANVKIMPKHIWEKMPATGILASSELNLNYPIGSGPYMVENTIQSQNVKKNKKTRSIVLTVNKRYYEKLPYIQKINITFLSNKEDLVQLLKIGALDAGFIDGVKYSEQEFKKVDNKNIANTEYFSIFFNTQKDVVSDKEIRKALSFATDKKGILDGIGQGYIVNSPILSEFYGLPEPKNIYEYNESKATEIFKKKDYLIKDGIQTKVIKKSAGFELRHDLKQGDNGAEVKKLQECLAKDKDVYPDGTVNGRFGETTKKAVIAFQEKYADEILKPAELTKGTGKVMGATLKKLNSLCFTVPEEQEQMIIRLKTVNNPTLIKVASIIKEQWEKIGVKVEIESLGSNQIKKTIVDKDYDAILFGERLGSSPELLAYWHSSQIFDPGSNLAVYQNEDLDKLLEKSRLYSDGLSPERIKILENVQDKILEDAPAIFLYSGNYNYLLSKNVRGFSSKKAVDPARIFDNISEWYLGEERVWK